MYELIYNELHFVGIMIVLMILGFSLGFLLGSL